MAQLREAKKQENITITTKILKTKTATNSEELKGSWTRWTARILEKDISVLSGKNSCTTSYEWRGMRHQTGSPLAKQHLL